MFIADILMKFLFFLVAVNPPCTVKFYQTGSIVLMNILLSAVLFVFSILVWSSVISGWWFGCHFLCSHILGFESSQLTNSYFSRTGWPWPTNQYIVIIVIAAKISTIHGMSVGILTEWAKQRGLSLEPCRRPASPCRRPLGWSVLGFLMGWHRTGDSPKLT